MMKLNKKVSRILKIRRSIQVLLGGKYRQVVPIRVDKRIVKS